jgi:hypothetical protein
VDTGDDFEDTIDMFESLEFRASRHLKSAAEPGDYDFTIFKKALVESLSYDEQSDIIGYFNDEKGFIEVNQDSKWRVALRYLASRLSSGILNFEIQNHGGHSRFGGHMTVDVSVHSTLLPSSPHTTPLARPPT